MINKIKDFYQKNKKKIIVGGGVVIGGVALAVLNSQRKQKEELKVIEGTFSEESDDGRDIVMNYTDAGTGEVLWKERCTEGYLNDTKEIGMEYEEVRKLNGLEEA